MQYYLHDGFLGHESGGEYNSLGHRCKELSELNLQNYILFACENLGTSLDLPVEKTFPYILSKNLKVDYYNLSIFRGGIDSIKFNLISWFSKIKNKPRAVVISCEFINSFLVSHQNDDKFYPCEYDDEDIRSLFHHGNYTGYFEMKNLLVEMEIQSCINSPIYQIVYQDREPILKTKSFDIIVDSIHPNHEELASLIEDKIRSNMMKVKP